MLQSTRASWSDARQLTAQLNRWAKDQQWPQSLQMLRELHENAQEANVIHLSCVLTALTERWILALELLEEMMQDDCEPDTICFNATICACENCGQLQAVLQLMQLMDDLQVPKSIVTFSSAISACGMTWQLALHLLWAGPRNTVSYSAAISSCEKAGNWSVMLLLLENMLRETLRPNVVTLSACVACCEKGREWRRALEVLRQMERMQVALEDGTVVGNDKVNLADCCDGQVRERTLQIYKAQSSFVKLKITIQAVSSIFSADEAAPVVSLPFRRSSSPRHRPSSSSAATSVKTPLRALSDLSPEAETPGRGTPGASPIQRALDLRRPRGKSSLALSSGQRFELDALEVVSQHASNTKDLAPRLMALCLRQLRASRLNALEQEEALQVFMVMLRRSREPSASCGVLFSAVPVLRREDLLARCETEAEASPSLTEVPHPKEASLIPPSLYTSPLYLDLEAEAGEVDHQLCRPLEELQEHLANIRSCALALAPPPDDVGGAQALQIVSAPVSPLTSVVGQEPSPSSAPELGKDKATSWNSRTLEAEPQAEAGEDGMAKIEAALVTAVVVQQIFTFLELAGGSGRQAGNIITALLGKLQELARDRELWIHRCLAEKELQYASSLCKKGLHERFLATPLPETAACR